MHPRGVSAWGQHDYSSWVDKPVWGEKYARPIVDRYVFSLGCVPGDVLWGAASRP